MKAGEVAARIKRSVLRLPSLRDWTEFCVVALALALLLAAIGFPSGLLRVSVRSGIAIAHIVVTAFFAPSLFEELVFRATLIPDRGERANAVTPIVISTWAFTAWHLVESLLLRGAAEIFARADFLASAALLGLTCAVLRRRSGAIWTAVALHWLAAATWIGWLGGPTLQELRG